MDYEGPSISPKIQALLDDALKDEDEINIEVSVDDALDNAIKQAKKAQRAATRPKTATFVSLDQLLYLFTVQRRNKAPPAAAEPAAQFPTSRGLVSSAKRFA
jgi:hypothetical protein